MLDLDAHILLLALAGELTRRETALLSGDTWSVSAIWGIAKLAEPGRMDVDLDDTELVQILARNPRLAADEIIGATSLVHRVPRVTRDRRIRKSRLVPLAT